MLRLDFSYSDLKLPVLSSKTRRASISGVQEKVQLKRVRGGFEVVESGGDYILTPAYDLLNTAVHFPNEMSATGLDFFADGHFSESYERLGFYSSADFIELGRCFGVPESAVLKMLATFAAHRDDVERWIAESRLSRDASARYRARFRDRLRAIAQ